MLKNAPAYRQAGICGVALILALLDELAAAGNAYLRSLQEISGVSASGISPPSEK